MTGERVVLALEAWKDTFALRMLGRCYRLCYLLFTETRLVELETDVLVEMVPRVEQLYHRPYGGTPDLTDVLGTFALNVLIDAAIERLGIRDRQREREELVRALSGDGLEDVVRFLRGYLGPRMGFKDLREGLNANYRDVEGLTVRARGSDVRLEVRGPGWKRRYELTFSDAERANYAVERLRAMALPGAEFR